MSDYPLEWGWHTQSHGPDSSRQGDGEQRSADALRNACINRCTDIILMPPRSQAPGTFDRCLAHCEGRAFFKNIQPFIPFPR
jgi:hypothetical protein